MSGTETYIISSQIYYDSFNSCYKRILTLDRMPSGPLSAITKRVATPKLSEFKQSTPCCPTERCVFALQNPEPQQGNELLTIEDSAFLITYLATNGYTINTSLTELALKNPVKSEKQIIYIITK